MPTLTYILLFIFGAAIGSFLNVVILRYDPKESLFKNTGGRSHCPHCNRTLRWYELVPLLSFAAQRGRCRSCKARLTWQYPLVELLSGLIMVAVPWMTISANPDIFAGLGLLPINSANAAFYHTLHMAAIGSVSLAGIWIMAFYTLLLIAAVDLRFKMIPDGLTIFLAILGAGALVLKYFYSGFGLVDGSIRGSFVGAYAPIFGLNQNIWINALVGVVFGVVFLGILHFGSRGRAMGFGDVKLMGAVGLLLGWPDSAIALLLAFILGSIISLFLMALGREKMKSRLPFAPFIVLGITLLYFFGYDIVNGYFRLFGLQI